MPSKWFGGLTGLAVVLSAAASAEPEAPPPMTKTPDMTVRADKPAKRDRVVCETEVATGSILSRTRCKTQGQIDDEHAKSVAALELYHQQQETQQNVQRVCEAVGCGGRK